MKGHILLKFVGEKSNAKKFLNGELYMNTMDYFWGDYQIDKARLQKEEIMKYYRNNNIVVDEDNLALWLKEKSVVGQKDMFEGVCATIDANQITRDSDFVNALASDLSLRAEGYRYCNIHSYYRLDYEMQGRMINWKDINPIMKGFGDYVVIIDDEDEFLNRVRAAVEREGYDFLCGSVDYSHPKKKGVNADIKGYAVIKMEGLQFDLKSCNTQFKGDSFDKMDNYAYQKEWRITLFRGEKSCDAYKLELDKNIKDIAHIVESREIENELQRIFTNMKFKPTSNLRWYGNINREDLREKFYQLGDYKAETLGMIG